MASSEGNFGMLAKSEVKRENSTLKTAIDVEGEEISKHETEKALHVKIPEGGKLDSDATDLRSLYLPNQPGFRVNSSIVGGPWQDLGRGDLDPFGYGGGMLLLSQYPQFRVSRPPFGNKSTGARFDPINPFGNFELDHDHLRPPGNSPFGYGQL